MRLALAMGLLACAGAARAETGVHDNFHATMDSVFGPGGWRITGGYRTQAREDELRAQGALTVAAGRVSRHSTGTWAQPGAYDVVVNGLDPFSAAAKLRKANAPFRTIFPEAAHGSQGAHLHIDPYGRKDARPPGAGPPSVPWIVANPTPEQLALAALYARAKQGDAEAQLAFGAAHAPGGDKAAGQNLVVAYIWTAFAAANAEAPPDLRSQAEGLRAALAARMTPDELFDAQQFMPRSGAPDAGQAFRFGVVIARPRHPDLLRVARAGQ